MAYASTWTDQHHAVECQRVQHRQKVREYVAPNNHKQQQCEGLSNGAMRVPQRQHNEDEPVEQVRHHHLRSV